MVVAGPIIWLVWKAVRIDERDSSDCAGSAAVQLFDTGGLCVRAAVGRARHSQE